MTEGSEVSSRILAGDWLDSLFARMISVLAEKSEAVATSSKLLLLAFCTIQSSSLGQEQFES